MPTNISPKNDPRFMYWGTGISNNDISGDVLAISFPSEGPFETERAVNSARNAYNVVVGQMVGRSVDKQNMTWSVLAREKWWEINRWLEAHGMFFYCKYFAHNTGKWMIRRFYAGGPSCTPYKVNAATGVPGFYRDCSLNVIDTGDDTNITVSTVQI